MGAGPPLVTPQISRIDGSCEQPSSKFFKREEGDYLSRPDASPKLAYTSYSPGRNH